VPTVNEFDPVRLAGLIKAWGQELGFADLGITDIGLSAAEARLAEWLDAGYHGDMAYMQRHGRRRTRPAQLIPGTTRVICARMDYQTDNNDSAVGLLKATEKAYIARYALGRDYHKTLRNRLQKLADRIEATVGAFGYRVFVDSAPVMEKPLAAKAGLGWLGKHTNLISKEAGSWFLLGEIYTDLPLPMDAPANDHCGSCRSCMDVCPTQAIIAPYVLDATRCISYLTIESRNGIPEPLRKSIGNRIFGCDDCQLFCPWNKFSSMATVADFSPRHGLNDVDLVTLFLWDEEEWERNTRGSALRRPGYIGWLRNIAVALGNAPTSAAVVEALRRRSSDPSELVREHIRWALDQHAR
jgi:epoxyqueuosine reductase